MIFTYLVHACNIVIGSAHRFLAPIQAAESSLHIIVDR